MTDFDLGRRLMMPSTLSPNRAPGPAFTPKHPLVSIGKAMLTVIGLNPQRIGTMSEGRVPGLPTFGGMDYQTTGLGDIHTRFEALTFPHIVGGLDAVALLQQHHASQEAVNYQRMTNNITFHVQMMGRVVIRHLYLDETKLHPFDGIGRRIAVEIDLIKVGEFFADPGLHSDETSVIVSDPGLHANE